MSLQGPWVWGLGPACHLSTWLDRLVTSQTAAATLRGLPVPSVTLRAGSARVGQAALVAAVTAASLVGGASHTASPVPAMDTPSRATHSQASARTAVEPPRAGTVRGEAALKGLGRGQDEGLGPAPCATAPRCLDGYYGDPTLGSGQRCQPCPCPGHPGSGLYHGTSCHMDSTSGRVLCLCAPGYAGEARLAMTNPQPRSLVHSPVRSTEQISASTACVFELQAGLLSSRSSHSSFLAVLGLCRDAQAQ